jgi:hypothetical protein
VKSVGSRAFAGCTGLKTVEISDGIERWKRGCFAGCVQSIEWIRLNGTNFKNLNGPGLRPAVRLDAEVEFGEPEG